MSLDLTLLGTSWETPERTWTADDAILYALGVGAGGTDPGAELPFTTENFQGHSQRVLPTFAILLSSGTGPELGDFDHRTILHAEQSLTLHRALPAAGTARTRSRITAFLDKGKDALAVIESVLVDAADRQELARSRSTLFLPGQGGFGGERGTPAAWSRPDRAPDHVITDTVQPHQALLYRLNGDRNPLHSDPKTAAKLGFPRPILHGLCTYGFAGRALLRTLCDEDPDRFGGMTVRFAAPVLPGQELTTDIWDEGDRIAFQARVGDTVVLDRGTFTPNG
ncbi:MaoC/PaaZ C-terminal domain-containing protein [Streptomyces sp. A1499]|uniref:MaoC/PaaZ C-terminal domain-containing protein n=1 Tax=Streptomyces sp. A1499 TaxID=2563104 RepID=UPI00109EBAE1|nr:MaoC/PaaZ C-terminal domain-containing protein [Streptomyces sp. A1499]THC43110.1 enoyl-CoA hydratase [Streptomyces sp. A1499]